MSAAREQSVAPLRRAASSAAGYWQFIRHTRRNLSRAKLPSVEADRILAVACTGHGASLAYVDRSGVVRASQLERWSGVKHTMLFARDEDDAIRTPRTKLDQRINYLFQLGFGHFPETRIFEDTIDPWREWLLRELGISAGDVDLVVTSDSHFATCWARLGFELGRWFPNATVVRAIEHHEIHERQAFWASGLEDAAVLTLDSAGESLPRRRFKKLAGTLGVMDRDGGWRRMREWLFPESSAGALFDATTMHVGFRQGEEGKTMGLSAFGGPDLFEDLRPALRLRDDGGFSFMSGAEFQAAMERYEPVRDPKDTITQRHMDVAYAGQALLDLIVENAWRAALELTGKRDLAYAGGVALNSVSNGKAWSAVRPRHVYIPPNPGDPGHALGCALFGAYEIAGWDPPAMELPEYLGPPYTDDDIAAAVETVEHPCERPADLATTVATCIANGHIVGRFDGGAEFGPRALGNRSILADPRRPGMKDYLNLRVKHREPFRPFAPVVLEQHASEWFELDAPSRYMLRVVPIRRDRLDRIPAVAHVDGTARVQTLTGDVNPAFCRVVDAFHARTGVPLVLNTSFNLAGKPIIETPADAVAVFASSEIDVLAIGPYVLSKQPLRSYVEADSGA